MLTFDHGDDMITSVEVNGKTLPAISQSEDRVDIGGYLVKGTNTIKIKVVTTMINRVKAENDLFKGGSFFGGSRPPGMSEEQVGGMPGGTPEDAPGPGPGNALRVSVFGASGIAGSRQWSGQEVAYGLTNVEIIPYGEVELRQ